MEQYLSVIHLYLCWSAQRFIDWLKASLDEVTGLMNHRSILWTLSITILLFVCVCYRNISNNPLAHIYSNQFDTMVNLQSLWVNTTSVTLLYWWCVLGESLYLFMCAQCLQKSTSYLLSVSACDRPQNINQRIIKYLKSHWISFLYWFWLGSQSWLQTHIILKLFDGFHSKGKV